MNHRLYSTLVLAGLCTVGLAAAAETKPKRPHVKVPPRLATVVNDPRFALKMHAPVVLMSGDGRQPYLFVSSKGTLFCQAQLSLPPFNSKPKIVYHTRIHSVISRDGGASWTPWDPNPNQDPVFIEGGMVERRDGTILMLDTFVVPSDAKPGYGTGEIWKSTDDLRTVVGPIDADFHLPAVKWAGSTNDF